MAEYNFDELVERTGSRSVKWDIHPEALPLWVADMDFKVAPFIIEALQQRLNHAVFGYNIAPESYYKATIDWFRSRRGWAIEREWILGIGGLVPALAAVTKCLCAPGDVVLFNSPAYNCFYNALKANDVHTEQSPLINKGGKFEIDWADLESRLARPKVKIYLFCNPHNPTGRIWSIEEMQRVGQLCSKHGVIVISDEIHCELEMPGHTFHPFAAVVPESKVKCITLNSPSKAFNLAGLQISNIICPDEHLREAIRAEMAARELGELNSFGMVALEAAYSEQGKEWLQQLNSYLWQNFQLLKRTVEQELPGFELAQLEGTYLCWLNISPLKAKGLSSKDVENELIAQDKVWINGGSMYGDDSYVRINIACPRERLKDGLGRMVSGFKRLLEA